MSGFIIRTIYSQLNLNSIQHVLHVISFSDSEFQISLADINKPIYINSLHVYACMPLDVCLSWFEMPEMPEILRYIVAQTAVDHASIFFFSRAKSRDYKME